MYCLISNGKYYEHISYTPFVLKMLAMAHSERFGSADIMDEETGEIMAIYDNGVMTYQSLDWD